MTTGGYGLVEALAEAAKAAREREGVSAEQIAVALGQSKDKVRYFESAKGFAALNELVDAYEDVAGISLCDLLDEAKANLKKNGRPSSSS